MWQKYLVKNENNQRCSKLPEMSEKLVKNIFWIFWPLPPKKRRKKRGPKTMLCKNWLPPHSGPPPTHPPPIQTIMWPLPFWNPHPLRPPSDPSHTWKPTQFRFGLSIFSTNLFDQHFLGLILFDKHFGWLNTSLTWTL